MQLDHYQLNKGILDAVKPFITEVIRQSAERHAKERIVLGDKTGALVNYIIEEIERL